jgi:hypothetical protein
MSLVYSGGRESVQRGKETGHDIQVPYGFFRRPEQQQETAVRAHIVALRPHVQVPALEQRPGLPDGEPAPSGHGQDSCSDLR